MARTVEQQCLACKRGRHDLCLLTRLVTRKTGKLVKVAVDLDIVADADGGTYEEPAIEMQEEVMITKLVVCPCMNCNTPRGRA